MSHPPSLCKRRPSQPSAEAAFSIMLPTCVTYLEFERTAHGRRLMRKSLDRERCELGSRRSTPVAHDPSTASLLRTGFLGSTFRHKDTSLGFSKERCRISLPKLRGVARWEPLPPRDSQEPRLDRFARGRETRVRRKGAGLMGPQV